MKNDKANTKSRRSHFIKQQPAPLRLPLRGGSRNKNRQSYAVSLRFVSNGLPSASPEDFIFRARSMGAHLILSALRSVRQAIEHHKGTTKKHNAALSVFEQNRCRFLQIFTAASWIHERLPLWRVLI